MHLMEQHHQWDGTARFNALIVNNGTIETAGDPGSAVLLAGGRVLHHIEWGDAIERIGKVGGRPVILLDARDVPDERVAGTLSQLDGLAAGRDLSIVVAIDERQIDIACAGLALSRHEILCDPRPLDWIGALACSHVGSNLLLHDRIGENEAARLARLNAEVARITTVLARLAHREEPSPTLVVEDRTLGYVIEPGVEPSVTAADIRQIVRARRLRDRHFGDGLFEDPAWDMILDLYAAHLERAQVSVSSLCIAAAVAPTTALRWIARLTEAGLFERRPDPFDRRRAFMSLSNCGLAAMHRYVVTIRSLGLPLV